MASDPFRRLATRPPGVTTQPPEFVINCGIECNSPGRRLEVRKSGILTSKECSDACESEWFRVVLPGRAIPGRVERRRRRDALSDSRHRTDGSKLESDDAQLAGSESAGLRQVQ